MSVVSWASFRTAVAAGGLVFSAGALVLACLDYAGEEVEACSSELTDAGADACADATVPIIVGSGSGS